MSKSASLPRVYDCWLGGAQHTPVDAAEGTRLSEVLPELPATVRAQRLFQREQVAHLAGEGISQFFVLGAGFPTGGHVHEQLPTARVFYSDPNFDVVQPGAGLLAGIRKRVLYRSIDPLNPDDLDGIAPRDLDILEDLPFQPLLSSSAPIGIVMVGFAEHLTDEGLEQALNNLFNWAAPGSGLILTLVGEAPGLSEFFAAAGQPFHTRSQLTSTGGWTLAGDFQPAGEGAPTFLKGALLRR